MDLPERLHGSRIGAVSAGRQTTPEAAAILDAGVLLARTYGTALSLVHTESVSESKGSAVEEVRRRLQPALDRYGGEGIDVSLRVLDAPVPEGIR